MTRALCIDLGGTNLRAGISTPVKTIPDTVGRWPAPKDLDGFRNRIGGLLAEHSADRLGIAIPGLADGTRCVWVPNLAYLDGVELTKLFPGMPLALGNDAQMALVAEAAAGAAGGTRNAILLAIGTGIGSAVLCDGRILRGEHGAATSFGWACADPADPGDDQHGWLERVASGTALDEAAVGAGLPDGAALIAKARGADARAIDLLAGHAARLGTALAGAVALLGSTRIVVSGGVSEGLDVLAPLVLNALRRHVPPHLRDVSLTKAAFGSAASLFGASMAAHGHPLWEVSP